jgi:hypothetical protein
MERVLLAKCYFPLYRSNFARIPSKPPVYKRKWWEKDRIVVEVVKIRGCGSKIEFRYLSNLINQQREMRFSMFCCVLHNSMQRTASRKQILYALLPSIASFFCFYVCTRLGITKFCLLLREPPKKPPLSPLPRGSASHAYLRLSSLVLLRMDWFARLPGFACIFL